MRVVTPNLKSKGSENDVGKNCNYKKAYSEQDFKKSILFQQLSQILFIYS